MSPVEFLAEVAWPVAVLVIAILYRKPLGRLVGGERTTLKAGPFELAWEQARPTLPRPAPLSAEIGAQVASPAGRLASLLVDLARESPAEAVIAAYGHLGEAFKRGLNEIGVDVHADRDDPLALAREAEAAGVTGPEITHALEGLEKFCAISPSTAPDRR